MVKIKQLCYAIYITTFLFSFYKWFYLQLNFWTFFAKRVLFSAALFTLFYSEVFISLHHSSRQQPIPWSPLSVLPQCNCISLPWGDVQKAFVLSPPLCLALLINCWVFYRAPGRFSVLNKCLFVKTWLSKYKQQKVFSIFKLVNYSITNTRIPTF